jgi:hypothetical protein
VEDPLGFLYTILISRVQRACKPRSSPLQRHTFRISSASTTFTNIPSSGLKKTPFTSMFANTKSGGLGIFRRHIMKTYFLGIACCVGISLYSLYIYDRERRDTIDQYLQNIPHPFGTGSPAIQDGATTAGSNGQSQSYCTAEEYANGKWMHRTNPPSSLDEVRTLYSLTVSRHRIIPSASGIKTTDGTCLCLPG